MNRSLQNVFPVAALLALGLCSSACHQELLAVAASIDVSPAVLAFGQCDVGAAQTIAVEVENLGSAPLTVTSIAISSDPNSELTLSSLLTTNCSGAARNGGRTLAPGECAQFDVVWTPTAVHAAVGVLLVNSSDARTPSITLPVTGNAIAASGCQPSCGQGEACCNGACVDTQSSPDHCGSCLACSAGDTCNAGNCVSPVPLGCSPSCGAGESCCDDACINTVSDPAHCGGCSPCASGDTCDAGVCTPPPMQATCDPVTAPCAGSDICCNHVCIDGSATAGLCPCTGGPLSNFAAGSIIIPMDVCWQRGPDTNATPSYCTDNRKTTSDDAPLKAYGLVFFLLRHKVTVYVAIDPDKTALDGVDMALVSLDTTPPVLTYDWTQGQAVALADGTQGTVQYRGGPFLIDSSQHDRVMSLLASDPDFAQFRSEGNITVHVATVGFQSTVARSITAVPTRIALLDPAGDDSSYQILVRYLASAGLDFPDAGGTPSAPGAIYDQLQEADFLPDYNGSNLKMGGYQLLWSPHWEGGTANTPAQLATIADFVGSGGNLFAECAAIGTLEGYGTDATFGIGGSVEGGSPATMFLSTKGMGENFLPESNASGAYTGPFTYKGFASPLAQSGDFPFEAFSGAITDFYPETSVSSADRPGVVNFISATYTGKVTDVFSFYDQQAAGKGTVVYLGGHDYSVGGGLQDTVGITAGSRLVLNTLFSLSTSEACYP